MTTLNVMECELELARKIFWLIKNDQIFLTSYNDDKNDWDDGAYPAINCNDLFVPGSDAEGLNLEDLDDYINVVKRWPNAGSQAWCAVKRSAKVTPWPWLNSNSEWMIEFDDAVANIPDMLMRHSIPRIDVVCPICGLGTLHPKIVKDTVEYKGEMTELPLCFSVCDYCGSEQADASQIRTNKCAMINFQKQIENILK